MTEERWVCPYCGSTNTVQDHEEEGMVRCLDCNKKWRPINEAEEIEDWSSEEEEVDGLLTDEDWFYG